MTRIDFYQLDTEQNVADFACRLVDKVYHQGRCVYVHTSDQQQAESIDDLLWTFKAHRFIPHKLVDMDTKTPVHIGYGLDPAHHEDVLINVSGNIPDFFSRFDRVAEIVPYNEPRRASARLNYRFYKDRGYPLYYHKL